MSHLSTCTVKPVLFTRQDFDEAMVLFRRANDDAEGTQSELDDALKSWITKWYPALTVGYDPSFMVPEVEPCQYYIALPIDDAIIFSPPDESRVTTKMVWQHNHPLLLVAVSVMINLCQCDHFSDVWLIIRDLRGNRWTRQPVDMCRRTAVAVRHNFYQLLGQLIHQGQEKSNEN